MNDPYVLVLGQKWLDKVLPFSHFENDLLDMVTELYDTSNYAVVFKPHPLNDGEVGSNGNLQTLIAGATAIYTMNSGSGFEALFQGKRVFTTGVSDYHWGTTELKTIEEFQNSKNLIEDPVDIDRINKFLYYCLTEYFMDINDTDSIEKKIQQTITTYNNTRID
jgi:capsule polysaccharide export protein KpsC/LpsZ